MNCKNCGSPLNPNSKFCGICGAQVESEIQNPVQPEVQQPEVQPTIVQPEMPTLESVQPTVESEPKQKKNFALPIILILLLIGILAGVYYYLGRPDKMVKSIINTAYDKLDKQVDKMYPEYETMLLSGNLSFDTNIEELQDIKKIKYNYQYGQDKNNNNTEMGMTYSEDEKKLIDAMMYVIENNLFISLKEDYPSIIKVEGEEIGINELMDIKQESLTKEETKYLLKAYKDIILESLDMKDFKKTSAKITIDGETTKVSKLTFKPTAENMSKLTNNMIEKTLEDDKLLDIFAKLTKIDKEMLKEFLESSKNTQATYDNEEPMTINFYTKGFNNEYVGMDIELNTESTIEIRKSESATTIEIKTSGEPIFIKITEEGNDTLIVITAKIEESNFTGKIAIKTNKIDTKTEETTLVADLKVDNQSLIITSNNKMQLDTEIAAIDTTNAKDYKEIPEEEINKLSETYKERIENSVFGNFIKTIMESMNNKMLEEEYIDEYNYEETENLEATENDDNIEDNNI